MVLRGNKVKKKYKGNKGRLRKAWPEKLNAKKSIYKAIPKKMSVGGNPSCCNLEALLEKFFQVFLRFTKIYFNDNH